MLPLVKDLKWKEVAAAISENPRLLEFRDERGRNWLHLCCAVKVKERGLKAADSIRTAEVLLDAGLGINQEAFSEKDFKATPLVVCRRFRSESEAGRVFAESRFGSPLLHVGCGIQR